MQATDPDLEHTQKYLSRIVERRIVVPLAAVGVETAQDAIELISLAMLNQQRIGVAPSDQIIAMLESLDMDGLVAFYTLKFGKRTLSFNRAMRLLSDMHEKWIRYRQI